MDDVKWMTAWTRSRSSFRRGKYHPWNSRNLNIPLLVWDILGSRELFK